ncbi:MAG: hypothetical protein JW708_07625, partial [Vallitaleaceae bacterium]|nr:hypothetical protein [Vallitaleaceae bacterium]
LFRSLTVFILSAILFMNTVKVNGADGTSYEYDGYTYDWWWNAVEGPAAFQLDRIIDESNMEGMEVQGINDVCTSQDGRIFLLDKLESRVQVMDSNGVLIKSIKAIRNRDDKIVIDEATGNQLILNMPEGVFYEESSGELYIADTGAGRILVLDGETYVLNRIITKPDNMEGVTEFKPSKVAVDHAGRMYIVIQSSYEGIVELNADGSFSRYFGVNSPQVNLIDYFWKSISTDAQKEQMKKNFAPAFNNVELDPEGFVYAVSYDEASKDMVFRLNSKGANVLREMGNTFVIGDLYGNNKKSSFVDIAVTAYGTYAVLDRTRGRVFIYDYDGQLLSAFGSMGKTKDSYQMPTGIAWLGDSLIVTDSTLRCAYILKPTEFGKAALGAAKNYYLGQWDDALRINEEILRLNANYEMAYIGIGKSYLMQDEYKKAMYYFKLGNNRLFYSKAFNGYRGEVLKENFHWVLLLFLFFIGYIVISEVNYHRKESQRNGER